jgi:hypothetical protein
MTCVGAARRTPLPATLHRSGPLMALCPPSVAGPATAIDPKWKNSQGFHAKKDAYGRRVRQVLWGKFDNSSSILIKRHE